MFSQPKKPHEYPFVKPDSHFNDMEIKVKIPDADLEKDFPHHSAVKIQKKPKNNPGRDQAFWFNIRNITLLQGLEMRANRLTILSGELLRLLDNKLPKYRVLKNEKYETIISKEIENAVEFFQYCSDKIIPKLKPLVKDNKVSWKYEGDDFQDGAGRGVMGKFFYFDDDCHFGNIFINKDNYFVVIDCDRCFAPLSLKFHHDTPSKTTINQSTLTLYDYDNLPLIAYEQVFYPKQKNAPTHHKVNAWQWLDTAILPYTTRIAKEENFLNEKYFATLKLFATRSFQEFLIQYHLNHTADQKETLCILQNRFSQLNTVCHCSSAFNTYLTQNRLDVLLAILYEFHEYTLTNRHYFSTEKKESQQQHATHINQIIHDYNQLLLDFQQLPLNAKECIYLTEFLAALNKKDPSPLKTVFAFYTQQKMRSYANTVKEKIHLSQKTEPQLSSSK